ncbi:hypothetical protein NQ314_019696, partial [Rhamnusium bicolor]
MRIRCNACYFSVTLSPNEPSLKPKQDINQWNVAVVVPPGGQLPPQPPQSGQPPIATSPGFVWLQVPASHFQNKPGGSQKPSEFTQTNPSTSAPPKEPTSSETIFPSNPFLSPGIQQPVGPAVHTTEVPLSGSTPASAIPVDATSSMASPVPGQSSPALTTSWTNPTTILPPTIATLPTAVEQACPEGLLFSAKGLYCDYPERVDCNQRPVVVIPPQVNIPQVPSLTTDPGVYATQVPTTGPVPVNPAITTQAPPTGELNKKCLKPRGQFSGYACNKFLNCWDGIATEQACPEGLLFNPLGFCDFSENVNCAGKPIEGSTPASAIPVEATSSTASPVPGQSSPAPTTSWTNPTTTLPPTIATLPTVDPILKKKCLTPRGQFPSTFCNKFINCWDNIILEQECPEGFLFSTKGYCDFPHNVNCGDRKIIHRSADAKAECPLENGTFRDKFKCNSYYTCISNNRVAQYECPEGFNFNDYLGLCDYAYRVDCSKEPLIFAGRRHSSAQANNEPMAISECPVDFAKYDCPTGFSFNDNIGVCDYAERVDCTLPPKIFQVNQNILPQIPADFKNKIANCAPGTVFRLNPQCTSACRCKEDIAEIIQCPAGLAYDSTMDKCILPHLAK